jgi:hypothetical protein
MLYPLNECLTGEQKSEADVAVVACIVNSNQFLFFFAEFSAFHQINALLIQRP